MGWNSEFQLDWNLEWHGVDEDPEVLPGVGSAGVYTLALDLKNGFQVTYTWITDVIKTRSGREQRISRNDAPKQSYSGSALLLGDNPRAMRAKMARYAAIGAEFLLGLPHEMATIRADSSGATLYVHSTTYLDWKNPGQRVVVVHPTYGAMDAVIQSSTSNTFVLDVTPGNIGKLGGYVMPLMPVLLEPQQNFARYPIAAEEWELKARASSFDFAGVRASLALGPITVSAAFDGVTLVSRLAGLEGNALSFWMDDGAYAATGEIVEASGLILFGYQAGVTTLGDLYTALLGSSYALMTGTYNPADTIALADEIPLPGVAFTGATGAGPVGNGASVTAYAGDGTSRPVWDREIKNAGTNTDGVHAMTEILDFGGKPYAIGTADHADWFRAVVLSASGEDVASEFQWWKLFLSTVKGRQKVFWLPTWRDDFTFVSKAANTVTISSEDGSDFFAWYPAQRQHIQIVETNETVTYAEVSDAVDNGDGTITLTIGTTLATSSVRLMSWLELCRFEGDSFTLTWDAGGFSFSSVARVVQL